MDGGGRGREGGGGMDGEGWIEGKGERGDNWRDSVLFQVKNVPAAVFDHVQYMCAACRSVRLAAEVGAACVGGAGVVPSLLASAVPQF